MFEFDQYDAALRPGDPVLNGMGQYDRPGNIAKMSFLVWGEHCVECTAPSCFSSCDLYQPRPDGYCRRLAFGVYKNVNFDSPHGYGAEIVFKKWGKIEARGNTNMEPAKRVLWRERLASALTPTLGATGHIIARVIGDARFKRVSSSLLEKYQRSKHRRKHSNDAPSAFLLEVCNPSGQSVSIQLFMGPAIGEIDRTEDLTMPPPFRTTLELPPGYSKHEIDQVSFRSVTECGLPFDISITPAGDSSAHLVFLTADFVTYDTAIADVAGTPKIKCVVFDLDGTVWKGTLLEDDKVVLVEALRSTLKTLDERGILLSVASKNNHEHAWSKLEELGIAEYFLYPQINWRPKSENVRHIAKSFNIGLDSIAFIDDNSFELEEVKRMLPEVTCFENRALGTLADDPRFAGGTSREARNRRRLYQEAIERENVMESHGEDYLGFLAGCDIKLEILEYEDSYFDRALELVQRTNQLNFSGRHYERPQIRDLLDDPGYSKFMLQCADKFGAYGMVGFAIIRSEDHILCVEDFMLSCRVQGKFVEQAFFDWISTHPRFGAPQKLWINFQETDRNQPAKLVLETIGFAKDEHKPGLWFDLMASSLRCEFIDVASDCDRDVEIVEMVKEKS